ncbi:plasmid mobilization protein [Noviherbaspirillum pedocola]|uniref:Plasmid mobilization relaxosome protein MobC n=1 Tax=Noviherbaspirillum pedocola TaxID=2801341 RepID=A0A934SNH4_9BURK|nr:plasmid mobilization relaxosome protein MobC [Noviherbaspirillum pedocola]MBK4733695.1 plasmid mobilization relaxosome protein MobC [Noviherbaspirillum pedocola]
MTHYKKFIEQKNLQPDEKKRPGQAGYDGNSKLRTRNVQIALSELEYEDLVKQFNQSSYSKLAPYCRRKLLSKEVKVTDEKQLNLENVAALYRLYKQTDISQTGKMGSNLNQIARKFNSNEGVQNFKEKMLEELNLMREMNRKLEIVLKKMVGGNS